MSIQGILLIDALCLGIMILLLNLVRTKRMYVSYAIIWLIALTGIMLLVSIPDILYTLPGLVGAIYPASALSLFAFVFIAIVLIFISVKLSVLNARQVDLIQRLAIKELEFDEERKKRKEATTLENS